MGARNEPSKRKTMYITVSDLETYTGDSYDTDTQNQLTQLIIPAVESAINDYTGRKFGVSGNPDSTMYYFGVRRTGQDYDPLGGEINAPSRSRELDIDEFVHITSVSEVDSSGVETAIDLSALQQLPLNTEYKDRLYALGGTAYGSSFSGYKYKVVGRLGTSDSVPAEVKVAALQIASDVLSASADVDEEGVEGYTYKRSAKAFGVSGTFQILLGNPTVLDLLNKWKKFSL